MGVVRYSIHVKTTPLHEAAKNGHLEICKLIMDTIDDKNPAIRTRRKDGWTPLHEAAENGHLEVWRLIIDNTENKNPICNREGNSEGVTPMQLAATNGHWDVIMDVWTFLFKSITRLQDRNRILTSLIEKCEKALTNEEVLK